MNKEALYMVGVFQGRRMFNAVKAVHFVIKIHGNQKRDDGKTDYVDHPIRVCRMLMNLGIDEENILVASLLHDSPEEGKTDFDEIRSMFGGEVVHIVDSLTKRKDEKKENYFERVSKDIRAILIKMLDRVCNVDDMSEVYSPDRLESYIKETEDCILPMAKKARRENPEYSDLLIMSRDYIKGILRAAKQIIELMNKIETLKSKIPNDSDIPF